MLRAQATGLATALLQDPREVIVKKQTVIWQLWVLGHPFLKTQWQWALKTIKVFKPSTWGPASQDFIPRNIRRKENPLVTVIRQAKYPQCQGNWTVFLAGSCIH